MIDILAENDTFEVDDIGIPMGRCIDCDNSKFDPKTDEWYCKNLRNEKTCEFKSA